MLVSLSLCVPQTTCSDDRLYDEPYDWWHRLSSLRRGPRRSVTPADRMARGLAGRPTVGAVRPFQIAVPRTILEELQRRLGQARVASFPLDEPRLGVDRGALERLLAYWREEFDWPRAEAELNRLEHVLVEVDGLTVHAVRVRGEGRDPLPLLIGHGWPSSFVEILPAVGALTRPSEHGGDPDDAFDVVIPSLTGYLYSDPPRELADATAARMADRFAGLMSALGYARYGASGGDVGARVVAWMAARAPDALVGAHMSCNAVAPCDPRTGEERAWLDRERRWQDEEGAYLHLQRTKPRTAWLALADSPVGHAAWILEKWSDWGETRGDPIGRFGAEQILTQVVLFWATGTLGTSFLTYTAFDLSPGPRPPEGSVTVPAGFYLSDAEPHGIPPRAWAERQYRVTRWTVLPRGGHFLPAEEPALFAADVREFFRPLRRVR